MGVVDFIATFSCTNKNKIGKMSILYPKINSIYKRDEKTKEFLWGQFSQPEFRLLYNNIKWLWTEKVDGTNIRIVYYPDFCSYESGIKELKPAYVEIKGRTNNAQTPSFLLDTLYGLFPVEKFLGIIDNKINKPESITLYGEGIGPKINNGGLYQSDWGFILFDIRIGDWWLKRQDVRLIGNKLGIKTVPVVGSGTLKEAIAFVKSKPKSWWGNFTMEGIVARPIIDLKTRRGDRIITKIKVCDFR